MFRDLQCVQKGRVRMPDDCRAAAVFADDYGGAWVLSADRQSVLYYTSHTLAAAMTQQAHALPSLTAPVAAPLSYATQSLNPPPPSTLAFCCSEKDDCVHAVLFFNSNATAAPEQHRRDACVVTEGGVVALLRVPTARDARPTLLQPYQKVHLDLRVSAAATMPGAVVLCCYDGTYTEVVRTVVVGEAAPTSSLPTDVPTAAASTTALCPHHSDAAVSDAMCTCAIEAAGLFRVEGRLACVVYDGVHRFLITISDAGNVDVWDVRSGCDATAQCGSPSWDTARYGTATCAVVCRDNLWVGLTSGQLLAFSLVSGDTGAMAVLRSHNVPLTDVVAMSMQSSVWSCAAGSGKVNVWNASDASFRGSFVFPASGVQAWCVGAAQVRTALWGIDGASGEPCLSQMTETLSRRDALLYGSDDVDAQREKESLLDAYRVCWRGLMRQVLSLSQRDDAAATAEEDADRAWRSEHVVAAVARIDEDLGGADDVHNSVKDLLAVFKAVQRLCVLHQRLRGGGSSSVTAVVDSVLHDWQRCQQEREEVDEFLRSVRDMQVASSNADRNAQSADSLEDVLVCFTQLCTQVEELTAALAAAANTEEINAKTEAAVAEATEHLRREVTELQDALHDVEARNEEMEARLRVAEEDAEAAHERQGAAERLLEGTEAQLDETRKSLLASKRAAEVKATEVSSLFDMEAKLHEAQDVIGELSAQVEQLLRDMEGKKNEVASFHRREVAFKDVLKRVLQAQNAVADEVGDFADMVDALVVNPQREARGDSAKSTKDVLRRVAESACRLDASVESRLKDQVAWFHTLSHELRESVA